MPKYPIARILIALTLLLPMQAVLADAANNAALRYWRGLALMSPELEETIKQVRIDGVLAEPAWAPDAGLLHSLQDAQTQSIIHEFLKGAALPGCDFGYDPDDGIEFLLPHLGGMRAAVTLLLADGRAKLAQGEPESAAERFAAVYAIAAHSTNDGFMVSSLIAMSYVSLANNVILQDSVLSGLRPEDRNTVMLGVSKFDPEDPFRLRRAVENEGNLMASWLRYKFKEPVSEAELKALMHDWFGDEDDAESLLKIVNDPDTLNGALAGLRLWYLKAVAAWHEPDSTVLLEAMDQEIGSPGADHAYGQLADWFVPAISRARKNELEGIERLKQARAMLAN